MQRLDEIHVFFKHEEERSYRKISLKIGLNLMHALKLYGIKASCGGFCSCASCGILISINEEISEKEKDTIDILPTIDSLPFVDIKEFNLRLSCQITVNESLNNAKMIILKTSL